MFPGLGFKQPYPQAMPPQMKASNSPFTYETWPHQYGYPYPVPPQCHSCCNQSPYTNYYPYMPHPCTHIPSPPPVHPQCYYPVYPGPSPFQYAPPPHYTMELPKYDYDKIVPHCHVCNNHSKEQGVKIEEHEPEAQNNKPVAWLPFDYLKSQEGPSDSTKPKGDGERDSKLSGWMPLDVEGLKRLLQNGKKDEDDEPKNQVSQMPFPMVWLPYSNEEQRQKSHPAMEDEDKNGDKLSVKTPRTIPVKQEEEQPESQVRQMPFPLVLLPHNNEEKRQKSIPGDKNGEKLLVEKRDKPVTTIPVKPLDQIDGTKAGNGLKAKEDGKKLAEKDAKSKPSSPTKASKLPPICLRIDPLPKKKTGEGKSRSPSPPRDKVRPVEAVKPSSSSSESQKEKNDEGKSRSPSPPRDKVRPIEVVRSPSAAAASIAEKDAVDANKPSRLEGNGSEGKIGELNQEAQHEKEKKSEKKMLSGEAAATIIQSAYRGYEVRRWEPLKKMREISKIQEEAAALKKCIEASADSLDAKQKTMLGENIMSLLLKLDTIQGLHSSIRDVRKLVAKELVNLQEMVDAVVIKKHDSSSEETITLEPMAQKDSMREDESKGLRTVDKSCVSSSLGTHEDHDEVEIKEDTEVKSCSLESSEMTHEQVTEAEKNTSASEEVGTDFPDSVSEHDAAGESAIKNIGEILEAHGPVQVDHPSVSDGYPSPVDQKSCPLVSESQVDSADKVDTNLLEELNVCPVETLKEVCEGVINEAEKLHESDETSKDVQFESLEKVQEESADSNVIEPVKVETQMNDESNKAKEDESPVLEESDSSVTEAVKVEIQVNEEAEDEEEAKLASEGSTKAKEDESKVQDEFDSSVTEQVKAKTQVNDEGEAAEEVKLTICSTENKGEKEQEGQARAMEDMDKMRDLLEKMIESGKKQQEVVCSLNQRIKELEGKLAKQKEMKNKKKKKARVSIRRGGLSKKSPTALPS